MNKVYFIRHAKPDFSVHDNLTRPLTDEGRKSSEKLINFFKDKNITKIYSSPYKRSIDTVKGIADAFNLDIELVEDFRERKITDGWIEDFNGFAKSQWEDFNYKLTGGEALKEVQDRNIKALKIILEEHREGDIVIGTHGTALSMIINYFNKEFNYIDFERIKDIMPWVVCIEFDGTNLVIIEELVRSAMY